eukprot:g72666.t1
MSTTTKSTARRVRFKLFKNLSSPRNGSQNSSPRRTSKIADLQVPKPSMASRSQSAPAPSASLPGRRDVPSSDARTISHSIAHFSGRTTGQSAHAFSSTSFSSTSSHSYNRDARKGSPVSHVRSSSGSLATAGLLFAPVYKLRAKLRKAEKEDYDWPGDDDELVVRQSPPSLTRMLRPNPVVTARYTPPSGKRETKNSERNVNEPQDSDNSNHSSYPDVLSLTSDTFRPETATRSQMQQEMRSRDMERQSASSDQSFRHYHSHFCGEFFRPQQWNGLGVIFRVSNFPLIFSPWILRCGHVTAKPLVQRGAYLVKMITVANQKKEKTRLLNKILVRFAVLGSSKVMGPYDDRSVSWSGNRKDLPRFNP